MCRHFHRCPSILIKESLSKSDITPGQSVASSLFTLHFGSFYHLMQNPENRWYQWKKGISAHHCNFCSACVCVCVCVGMYMFVGTENWHATMLLLHSADFSRPYCAPLSLMLDPLKLHLLCVSEHLKLSSHLQMFPRGPHFF